MIEHDVEQGTQAWDDLRGTGIPTASEFSRLVTSQCLPSSGIDEYAIELAARKYAGHDVDGFGGNKYTERGKELEPLARADYEMKSQQITTRVGFCTDNMKQYGCSPDDFVGTEGTAEYKCKIGKEHIKAMFYYLEYGTVPPEYFAQPQGVLFITKRKWCDLVFYHPSLPGLIIRQYPDKDFFRELRKQLKEVAAKRNVYYNKLVEIYQNPCRR